MDRPHRVRQTQDDRVHTCSADDFKWTEILLSKLLSRSGRAEELSLDEGGRANREFGVWRTSAVVMSWGRTEGILRFYIFGEDLASACVLRHQTSTVLEFRARDRQGFGGLDDEFEGQSMLISD